MLYDFSADFKGSLELYLLQSVHGNNQFDAFRPAVLSYQTANVEKHIGLSATAFSYFQMSTAHMAKYKISLRIRFKGDPMVDAKGKLSLFLLPYHLAYHKEEFNSWKMNPD